MNFQQLEYIAALDEFKHFRKAAEHCNVTQPTLSMMVKKLEEELGASLFDRSKQPVVPTELGKEVISKARRAIHQIKGITEVVRQHQGQVIGKFRIGIIPTLAPYLLPLFVQPMLQKYPDLELQVKEMVTDQVAEALLTGTVDVGIVTTCLSNTSILKTPLFYEKFYTYVSSSHPLYDKQHILPEDIDENQLWLLEEGYCFRNQVINLEVEKKRINKMNFKYEAGSIDTLKRIVEQSRGITILPELALCDMDHKQQQLIRPFKEPGPMREVSLVTNRCSIKKQLVQVLKEEILDVVPDNIVKRQPEELS